MATGLRAGSPELDATLEHVREGIINMSKHTIYESEFKTTLLQLALAFHSGYEDINLGFWIEKAGSVYNGITVLDDNTGEALLRTPSLIAEASLQIESGLYEIIAEAGECQKRNLDTSHVYQIGLDRASTLELSNGVAHVLGWYEVFKRYGIKMVIQPIEGESLPEPEIEEVKHVESDWGDGELG